MTRLPPLGFTVTDTITGFTGVVTGHASYLSGCSQLLVSPKLKDDTFREPQWFDEQRCQIDFEIDRVALDNGATPGCDKAAPKR